MFEAICTKLTCQETFVPHSDKDEDLRHDINENGDECGGWGIIVRHYLLGSDPDNYDEAKDRCTECFQPWAGREIVRLEVGGWKHFRPCWLRALDRATWLDSLPTTF